MSYIYSQALVAEYLADCNADIVPCAPLKSIHTVDLYLCGGKTTDCSRLSRFGMTFEHLTDDDGEALLTWYQEDSRAKVSVVPESEWVSEEKNHPSGLRCSVSFGRYNRDMSSWRTPMNLFGTDSTLSSKAWTQAGTMRNGECWARPTLAHPIAGNDAGFSVGSRKMWRTPITSQGGMLKKLPKGRQIKLSDQVGGKLNPPWVEWLMNFPIGFTDLKPLATPKCRFAPPSLGNSCMSESMNSKEATQ